MEDDVTFHNYLIIGGGMTADAAVQGIRDRDKEGSIGLITNELYAPYNRPPLSKALWKGATLDTIWRKTAEKGATLYTARTARQISLKDKVVTDDRGDQYRFEKLLVATGGNVRRLPFEVEGIVYFRTLDDYQRLRLLAGHAERFVVIGGGFIGTEIAAALAINGKSVTMVFPEASLGARVYPPRLSGFIHEYYRTKGVTILHNDGVARIVRKGKTYTLKTANELELDAEVVVAGLGITPDTELAQSAGLKTENGILVDELLRTSHPDIFAAGDVANFFSPSLGKRVRVEHEDNALTMGEAAGKNMAGAFQPYTHLPFFYSDLFDLGYEAVGELDARHEIVEDWKDEFKEGVVYYLEGQRVRGVLLWNVWGQVENARALIADPGPFTRESLKGKIPA